MSRARVRADDRTDCERPECPRCGARIQTITTLGPGEHVASCGCRIGGFRLREIQ